MLAWRWLDAPPDAWRGLLGADPSACPSHEPAVWAALASALPGFSTRVAVVEESGALVGGTPVLLERRAGLTWLHALPWLLPAAPLARAGQHAAVDAAVATALAALARETRAVGGEWACYRPAGPEPAADALDRVAGETRWFDAALVDLAGGTDAALRRMDRKARQSLRAQREAFAFEESPGALEAAYRMHLVQSRQWAGHRALPLELSRRLLAGAGEPVARLFTLRDARGLASAALALDGPRETFVWWSGTHPGGRPAQAFTVLLWSIVEWAAERGRARVNLGASTGLGAVSSFKRSLGAEDFRYPVRWLGAPHAPAHARLVAALQRRLREGRARGSAA